MFVINMFVIKVSVYDREGNVTSDYDLKDLLDDSAFEDEYLNEHMIWSAKFIENITILSLPDNNNIIVSIKHDNSLEDLITYLNDFVENHSPYHDYLNLIYEDSEGYQCALSIDSIQPYSE